MKPTLTWPQTNNTDFEVVSISNTDPDLAYEVARSCVARFDKQKPPRADALVQCVDHFLRPPPSLFHAEGALIGLNKQTPSLTPLDRTTAPTFLETNYLELVCGKTGGPKEVKLANKPHGLASLMQHVQPKMHLPSATFWTSHAVVTGVFPFPPPVLAFIFIPHRVRHFHFSALHARRFPTNLANSRSRAFRWSFFCKKKSLRALLCTW